jgi:hypothetical protein
LKEKPDCGVCIEIHNNRNQEPPCEECIPPLLPGNEEIFRVYSLSANQLIISGMGEPIDVNIPAVISIMELLNVEKKTYVLARVVKEIRSYLKGYREEKEQSRELERMKSKGGR